MKGSQFPQSAYSCLPFYTMNKYYKIYVAFLFAFFIFSLYSFISLTLISPTSSDQTSVGNILLEENDVKVAPFDAEAFMDSAMLLQVENDGHVFEADDNNLELEMQEQIDEPQLTRPRIFWPQESHESDKKELEGSEAFKRHFKQVGVKSTIPSTWKYCGRPSNAFVTLNDGQFACVRHRKPHNYLTAGEVLSRTLGGILGISHIPASFLSRVSPREQWKTNLTLLQWTDFDIVAVIKWVDKASTRVKIPLEISEAINTKRPVMWNDIQNMLDDKIHLLKQWSDLIVFDFITGHFDRVASLQDEADKQNSDKPLQANVPNLLADDKNNLWLIDNEAGLLDAYHLLYKDFQRHRFQRFHDIMLNSMCLFKEDTVYAVNHLYQNENPLQIFMQSALKTEPLLDRIRFMDDIRFGLLRQHFKDRLAQVIAHWKHCGDIIS